MKYDHIDFKPPEGVANAAKLALEMRREHGRGGTEVGVARASTLSNRKNVSPATAKRMKSYFSRHESDKKGAGWSPGEEGYPSAGRIAWGLWGGDPGFSWSKKLVRQIDSADNKQSASTQESFKVIKADSEEVIHEGDWLSCTSFIRDYDDKHITYTDLRIFGKDMKQYDSHKDSPVELKDTEESKKKMDNPCWKGYEPIGMKKLKDKDVPNCVPVNSDIQKSIIARLRS